MGNKNYSKFSRHFEKKEKNDKPLEGQVTIDEVFNNDVLTEKEVEALQPEEIAEVKPNGNLIGVVTGCEKLNLREGSNKDSKVLAILTKGTEVEVELDAPTTSEFYKVKTASGIEGYCMKKFITIK